MIWDGKKQDPDPGSGMNNPHHISESLETIFFVKILAFFDADPGWTNSDPGWKKFGSGINIPDLQHCIYLYGTGKVHGNRIQYNKSRLKSKEAKMKLEENKIYDSAETKLYNKHEHGMFERQTNVHRHDPSLLSYM